MSAQRRHVTPKFDMLTKGAQVGQSPGESSRIVPRMEEGKRALCKGNRLQTRGARLMGLGRPPRSLLMGR